MHLRPSLIAPLFILVLFVAPHIVHAGVPFFGPIIPNDPITIDGVSSNQSVCAGSFGMLIVVINRLISLLLTLLIIFVAPLLIAYAGFLFVVNPVNSNGISEAKSVLRNVVVGTVLAFASYLIVAALMAVLYNANAPTQGGVIGAWSDIIGSRGQPVCIDLKGSLNPATAGKVFDSTGSLVPAPPSSGGACTALSPITDPLAQQMENGQTVVWGNTDPRLQGCVNRFISQVGGTVTSAYRPQAYQNHFLEIRDRWCTQGLRSNTDPACGAVKSSVAAEVAKHFGAGWACGAVGATSRHTSGTGVDISGINQGSPAVQQAASQACLQWQNYPGDPYHYDLKAGCSCQ